MTILQRQSTDSQSTLRDERSTGSIDEPFDLLRLPPSARRLRNPPRMSPQVVADLERRTEKLLLPLDLWEAPGTDETARSTATLQRDRSQPGFRVIGIWDGVVTDVGEDAFEARVVSLLDQGSELEAEFSIEDLEPDDRSLLRPGAIFYWHLGYQQQPRRRVSEIRFRRVRAEIPAGAEVIAAVRALFRSSDQSEPAEG